MTPFQPDFPAIGGLAAAGHLAGLGAEPTDGDVDTVLKAIGLDETKRAAWWGNPCDWLEGRRPATFRRRGQVSQVYLATVAAFLQAVAQLRMCGASMEASIAVARLREAGAAPSLVQEADVIGRSGSILKGPANDA